MAISFKAKKSKFYTKNLSTSTALKWCSVEKTFKSPLDRKEIKPIYPKANQPWIFIGRTDVKAPMLWPPDAKNWFFGKKKKKNPEKQRLKAGEEGKDRGWDGWMASPTINWFIGKNPEKRLKKKKPEKIKDWRQEKKGNEDEMVGWHHQLDGHELDQGPGVGNGQGSLECRSPWGHKELDKTERLNWTELP